MYSEDQNDKIVISMAIIFFFNLMILLIMTYIISHIMETQWDKDSDRGIFYSTVTFMAFNWLLCLYLVFYGLYSALYYSPLSLSDQSQDAVIVVTITLYLLQNVRR